MATKAEVRSLFSALVMTRFWIPVGVGLGAAADWDAAAVAAGTLVWPVSGPVLLSVRCAEQAVMPAAASKARPTTIPQRFTIVRTLPPLCESAHFVACTGRRTRGNFPTRFPQPAESCFRPA